ncbi:unnamed protein product [Hymenolepis diminuta]|nr:unnamed protein product [Hymenolepis diminuta]
MGEQCLSGSVRFKVLSSVCGVRVTWLWLTSSLPSSGYLILIGAVVMIYGDAIKSSHVSNALPYHGRQFQPRKYEARNEV